MKIQAFLKIAVVATAALAAYAFSGNQNVPFKEFYRHDGEKCTDLIEAMCDTDGTQSCFILVNQDVENIFDLSCIQATHVNSTPVAWRNK